MKRNREGFTLIELLVSIAMIGTMAAFMVVATRGAHEKVQSSSCMNNMRQITIAATMYADDHNSLVPDVLQTANYIQDNKDVYRCPRDNDWDRRSSLLGENNTSYTQYEYTPVSLGAGLPSQTALYFETNKAGEPKANITRDDIVYRHNGQTVVVFISGYVRSFSNSEVLAEFVTGAPPPNEGEIPAP